MTRCNAVNYVRIKEIAVNKEERRQNFFSVSLCRVLEQCHFTGFAEFTFR